MKACPIAFHHPSEAQQLHGLGPKLCERLTSRLKDHCAENGLPMPEVHGGRKRAQPDATTTAAAAPPPKKARKPKPYVPTLRSGPYAILLALSSRKEGSMQGLGKNEVIELAQPYCDSSFTAPSDPSKYFTAWNSMKTLLEKDLVFERGRPMRVYALTEDGVEVARRIRSTGQLGPVQCAVEIDEGDQVSGVTWSGLIHFLVALSGLAHWHIHFEWSELWRVQISILYSPTNTRCPFHRIRSCWKSRAVMLTHFSAVCAKRRARYSSA